VARAKKPSQAGIWAALGILVVALGGGVWYFTEHRTTPDNPEPIIDPGKKGNSDGLGLKTEPEPIPPPVTPPIKEEPPPAVITKTEPKKTQKFVEPPPKVVTVTPKPEPPPPVKPAVDTRRVNAAIKMGEFYFDRGEYEKAIEEFEQGLALDPTNQELRSRVARARRAKSAEDLLNQ